MSQTTKRYPKLSIKNKPGAEGKLTTGQNVQVSLDDKRLPTVSFLKIELKPNKIAKVLIEMYAELDAELYAEVDLKAKQSKQSDA